MVRIKSNDIQVTREDDLSLLVQVEGSVDTSTDTALFTVKRTPRAEEKLIEKELPITADDNGRHYVEIVLTHEDTDLPPRAYVWDLRVLHAAEGDTFTVETPMDYATFEVSEVVGDV